MSDSRGGRWLKGVLIVVALLAIGGLALNALYLADLRPDAMVDSAEAREAGAAQLEALARAHGQDAWQSYQTMDVLFGDVWHGGMPKRFFMHWEQSPQKLRGRFVRGTWTGELELLSGPDKGDRWGMQGWKSWTAEQGEAPEFEEDELVEFVVPTTQYFLVMPLRLKSATVALNAGHGSWKGETYDRVFATWESAEPVADMDQYLLWIDPDTGLLARADFTVRDQGGWAVGSATYNDYEDFGGVMMAKEIAITAPTPGGEEMPIHSFLTETVEWDAVSVDDLRPDPTIADEGESKPNS